MGTKLIFLHYLVRFRTVVVEIRTAKRQNLPMPKESSFSTDVGAMVESEYERSLSPKDFNDFLGQKELLAPLKLMITACQQRDEVLEHLLFTGQPGLGKTSLALALGNELQRPLKIISGPALNRAKDLVGILSQLTAGSILFIDEIHTLIGAGGAVGQGDAANLLKPALARGELRTIGATTWSEYKKYIEK